MEGDVDGVDASALTEKMFADLVAAMRAVTSALPTDSFEEVVARIIVDAARTVEADRAAAWLQRDDAIEVVATTGMRATTVDRFLHVDVAPDTPGETLLRCRTPVTWSTHEQAQRYFPVVAVANLGSGFVSPLHTEGEFAGVLFIGWTKEHRALAPAEHAFLEGIAHCCALAVERAGAEREPQPDDGETVVALGEALSVRLTTANGASVAWIAGEVDCANEADLDRAIAQVMRTHTRGRLGFDLAGIEFLSVAGARMVLAACGRAPDTYILNASTAARRVIDLLATDDAE
jgi:anti-anti-sigma regulatory factor